MLVGTYPNQAVVLLLCLYIYLLFRPVKTSENERQRKIFNYLTVRAIGTNA